MNRRFRVLMFAVMALLALSACSFVTGEVKSEGGLSGTQERYLVKIGLIGEREEVRFFTSGGLAFEEQGSLFTDVRVGTYWLPEDRDEEHRVESVLLKDVQSIEFTALDSWTDADYVTVTPKTGEPLKVYLPDSDESFIKRFHEALTKQWQKVRGR